ncbi:hypothetical protein BU15DRAFT_83205 [Melanogaster broomeanus]|nr:hypothetical protein BU15DRAFT_83205 [Melanogaster broomeanus]
MGSLTEVEEHARAAKPFSDLPECSQSHVGDGGFIDESNYGQAYTPTWSSSYNPFDLPADDGLASPVESDHPRCSTGSDSRDISRSPKPARLSLGALSNFGIGADSNDPAGLHAKGYVVFDDDIASFTDNGSTSLSPTLVTVITSICNLDKLPVYHFLTFWQRSTPSTFIPSSLISVLDSPSADWKGGISVNGSGSFTSSPVSFTGHSSDMDPKLDLFELRHRAQTQRQSTYDQMPVPYRTLLILRGSDGLQGGCSSRTAQGLNPDAKVFRLPRRKLPASDSDGVPASSYDALNPTGLMSSITTSTPSSLLRAFAPSRAEREVFAAALGGSTNTSLERLPSLSDVGVFLRLLTTPMAETQRRRIGEKDCTLPRGSSRCP